MFFRHDAAVLNESERTFKIAAAANVICIIFIIFYCSCHFDDGGDDRLNIRRTNRDANK